MGGDEEFNETLIDTIEVSPNPTPFRLDGSGPGNGFTAHVSTRRSISLRRNRIIEITRGILRHDVQLNSGALQYLGGG